MRVTLYVERTIPGFAEAGSYILLEISDQGAPVTVATTYEASALQIVMRYRSHLSLASGSPPRLAVLRALVRILKEDPPPGDELRIRLVE